LKIQSTYTLTQGDEPLLISMPHIGTKIPAELCPLFVDRAQMLEDTDWHLAALYNFTGELKASVLKPIYSRYVIDLNRPPNDTLMYPGASNTELCPTRFFTGHALYREGLAPNDIAKSERREQYWQPYHDALTQELERIVHIHGYALLWDAHSIRGQVPWLFEGTLPDLNIGTANGQAADPLIATAVAAAAAHSADYSQVLNGRFKGGFITRNYGNPSQNIHAVQLEKCRHIYMQDDAPFDFDEQLAAQCRPTIRAMIKAALSALENIYARS
jgi:N-formylglutamate deformylase